MKLFIGIFLIFSSELFAQNSTDSNFYKKAFIQNGQKLTVTHLLSITKKNKEAYKEMKLAKINHLIGSIFGLSGGALVGFPVGTALAGKSPEWSLAILGVGFIGLSIPFSKAYIKHAKKAVEIYNSGLSAQ